MDWEKQFDYKFPRKLIRKSLNWGLEDDPVPDIKVFIQSLLDQQAQEYSLLVNRMTHPYFDEILEKKDKEWAQHCRDELTRLIGEHFDELREQKKELLQEIEKLLAPCSCMCSEMIREKFYH